MTEGIPESTTPPTPPTTSEAGPPEASISQEAVSGPDVSISSISAQASEVIADAEATTPITAPGPFAAAEAMVADSTRPSEQPPADTPPETPQEPGANREDDIHKAETMAHTEHDFRSKAAESRELVSSKEGLAKKALEAIDINQALADKAPQQFGGIQRLRMRRKSDRLTDEVFDTLSEGVRANDAAGRTFRRDFSADRHPDGPQAYVLKMTDPAERAKYYDKQASRLGEWTGILHDHPLSEEYLKTHTELPSDPEKIPKVLVRLEDNAAALERIIARDEKHSRNTMRAELALLLLDNGGIGSASPQVQELNRLMDHATPEEADEHTRLAQEMHAKAKEFDGLHDRLYDRLETEPLRQQVGMIGNILNDVRQAVGLPLVEPSKHASTLVDQPQEGEAPAEEQGPPSPAEPAGNAPAEQPPTTDD